MEVVEHAAANAVGGHEVGGSRGNERAVEPDPERQVGAAPLGHADRDAPATGDERACPRREEPARPAGCRQRARSVARDERSRDQSVEADEALRRDREGCESRAGQHLRDVPPPPEPVQEREQWPRHEQHWKPVGAVRAPIERP